ncbi:hypothetical protein Poli38472_006822 [Pythium oligandrum]|uniref:NADH dehydrogenase [ubiquinone] 1 alpha subcomplex assembly factor 3 n=1 Tax=Pythium oligandrum TaxID=41045 RepID=A0A8K1C5C2_PYTOL|nr:hypothetical protein Poli38472_006822 [Pythium oligandrum]|eukprot:TMW56812.1 hypothetical protein Poli38472_006822 [Pythium oligandrum]
MAMRSGLLRAIRGVQATPRGSALRTAMQQRRDINYGHDMHKEMLNGTAKISVTEYDDGGFVVNDVNLRGGVVLFPEIAMLWKPKRFEEITKESLELFTFANPPVEILVLGCGARLSRQLDPELAEFLKVNGIVVEYSDSANACSTFNILNAEDRKVAAAILPCEAGAE